VHHSQVVHLALQRLDLARTNGTNPNISWQEVHLSFPLVFDMNAILPPSEVTSPSTLLKGSPKPSILDTNMSHHSLFMDEDGVNKTYKDLSYGASKIGIGLGGLKEVSSKALEAKIRRRRVHYFKDQKEKLRFVLGRTLTWTNLYTTQSFQW
jgi:hypothetical protein